MAIHYMCADIVKRSKKQSALAKSAYITRGIHYDELSGQIYDYRYRGNALCSEILIPPGSPHWLIETSESPQKLWTLSERVEKRHDAQIAREYVVALPHELPLDQLLKLAAEWILMSFVSKGMVASYSVHPPNSGGDPRNIHMHIMLTMRVIGPECFLNKERSWNDKTHLFEVRRNWMDCANKYLELNFCTERVEYSRLKQIKSHLLSELGMKDAPDLSKLLVVDRSVGNLQGKPQEIGDFLLKTLQNCDERSEIYKEKENLTDEQKYWVRQHIEIRRTISLENIVKDISRGRVLCAEDFYNLGKNEHDKIKKQGLGYLFSLVNQQKEWARTFHRER